MALILFFVSRQPLMLQTHPGMVIDFYFFHRYNVE
jgi:hypothetical protein